MIIDKEKAWKIFDKLCGMYVSKEYPFNQPDAQPPQIKANLPPELEWGSREHAMFLFVLCFWMRGGIKSHTATRELAKLYILNRDIFLPENANTIDTDKLVEMFIEVGLGFNAKQISEIWKENLMRISSLWDNDPRNILKGVETYQEACLRIQNKKKRGFLGFQEKMVSMLIYFFMDAGIVDRFNFPIPVDFHVLRIVVSHEIVKFSEGDESAHTGFYTLPILNSIRVLLTDYCREKNVDPVLFCEALWLFSGLMCNQYPGNKSLVGENDENEKNRKRKRSGRRTPVEPVPVWTPAQMVTYERFCRVCPVPCEHAIPSAIYYIHGKLVIRGPHIKPPQMSILQGHQGLINIT